MRDQAIGQPDLSLALAEPTQHVRRRWIIGLTVASLGMWMATQTPLQVMLALQLQDITRETWPSALAAAVLFGMGYPAPGTVDPLRGEQAIRDAERAVTQDRVLGFHFHPIMGRYSVDDPALMPLFGAINGLGVAVLIDVGTTGMGAGMPGGNGTQIKQAHPLAVDQLAATFPELTIIAAHPGWPWIEDMTAVALHKGNVYWDLSGWAPKHFPAGLRTDIRGRLQDKIMFGSDYPSLPLSRLLREWDERVRPARCAGQ